MSRDPLARSCFSRRTTNRPAGRRGCQLAPLEPRLLLAGFDNVVDAGGEDEVPTPPLITGNAGTGGTGQAGTPGTGGTGLVPSAGNSGTDFTNNEGGAATGNGTGTGTGTEDGTGTGANNGGDGNGDGNGNGTDDGTDDGGGGGTPTPTTPASRIFRMPRRPTVFAPGAPTFDRVVDALAGRDGNSNGDDGGADDGDGDGGTGNGGTGGTGGGGTGRGDLGADDPADARNFGPLTSRLRRISDFVGSSDPADHFAFTAQAGQEVDLRLTGNNAAVRLQLYLDANEDGTLDDGELVRSTSVTTGSRRRTIIHELEESGLYVVAVTQSRGSNDYVLRMRARDDDAAATAIAAGTFDDRRRTFRDSIGRFDRRDLYRVQLDERADFTARLTDLSRVDADLALFADADGDGELEASELIAESTLAGTRTERLAERLDAGTYFVSVTTISGRRSTDYRLVLEGRPVDEAVTEIDLGDLGDAGELVAGSVGAGESDVFLFNVTEDDADVEIDLTGMSDDADLALYRSADSGGAFQAANRIGLSSNGADEDEAIDLELDEGTYAVVVTGVESTAYTLRLTRSVSADA